MKRSVLIAGVGGASLGTEIFKSLRHSGNYNIFGADISPYAYGLYQAGFVKNYTVDRNKYIADILGICKKEKIDAVIPGGEEPLLLLYPNKDVFDKEGFLLAINSKEVIDRCVDKIKTFDYLNSQGIIVPITKVINNEDGLRGIKYPCIIKPFIRSGGSVFVYLAEDKEEACFYISYLRNRDINAVVQEYISSHEGEYTVGVLSLPNQKIAGSIAMRRLFVSKLSYLFKYDDKVISSGYSQGLIDDFKDIRAQAENIALKLKSRGPLNIQGRVRKGVFYPFEINARFSASTYLRTMAGFNEVDKFLQFLFERKCTPIENTKYGYYLSSFDEEYVKKEEIIK